VASEASDADAVESIKGDDVAFPCIHAPDRPDGRIASGDPAVSVSQGHRSGDVGADLISLDNHSCRATANVDAVGARIYHIGCTGRVATDGGVE
jgi:hypothetical protein